SLSAAPHTGARQGCTTGGPFALAGPRGEANGVSHRFHRSFDRSNAEHTWPRRAVVHDARLGRAPEWMTYGMHRSTWLSGSARDSRLHRLVHALGLASRALPAADSDGGFGAVAAGDAGGCRARSRGADSIESAQGSCVRDLARRRSRFA